MYPYWRALVPQFSLATKAGLAMFSYGFYRGFCADYKPPHDLFSHRMASSFFNGIFYVFPPYGLRRLFDTVNRVDVVWNEKDPKDYPSLYSELGGLGYNGRVV